MSRLSIVLHLINDAETYIIGQNWYSGGATAFFGKNAHRAPGRAICRLQIFLPTDRCVPQISPGAHVAKLFPELLRANGIAPRPPTSKKRRSNAHDADSEGAGPSQPKRVCIDTGEEHEVKEEQSDSEGEDEDRAVFLQVRKVLPCR